MRNFRAEMMIEFFQSRYHTIREPRRASEVGLESWSNLSSWKRIMTSAVVCSLPHLKASRETEVTLKIYIRH